MTFDEMVEVLHLALGNCEDYEDERVVLGFADFLETIAPPEWRERNLDGKFRSVRDLAEGLFRFRDYFEAQRLWR